MMLKRVFSGRGVETNERLSRIQIPKNMVEVGKYDFFGTFHFETVPKIRDIFVFANFIVLDVLQHSKIPDT